MAAGIPGLLLVSVIWRSCVVNDSEAEAPESEGCASVDVMSILKKARQDVVSCVASIDAERADAVPAVFTKIHLTFKVTGHNLKPAAVERAARLSAEQYCSVSKMLEGGGVEITHSVEINDV